MLELIDEAAANGVSLTKACAVVGLASTTIARWRVLPPGMGDGRRGPKTKPANSMSDVERAEVIELMNTPEYSSMSPCTLVPMLASMGIYVASESTFYRIAREASLLRARGRARVRSHRRPREFRASLRVSESWPGRPPLGDMQTDGYVVCPNCENDYFVIVSVKRDIIVAVEIDSTRQGYIT
ncbi:hypothetical protein ACNOYE_14215 [Nannocystaceae bacterium ST9]